MAARDSNGEVGRARRACGLIVRVGRAVGGRVRTAKRRGVASVLAMMFLIMFGSLVAAMAVVSRGNIRTAETHQHVLRAMGAAETGMRVAEARLGEAASRFVVAKSTIDGSFAWNLWMGNTGSLGTIDVKAAPSGHDEEGEPSGLAEAVANIHAADENIVELNGLSAPVITSAMAGADLTEYMADGWVMTPAISLGEEGDALNTVAAFQIIYAPLANGTDIRAIVVGYDLAQTAGGEPVTRTMMKDFRLAKRVDHAIISPSRILIGKNVHVEGDMGARYSDINQDNGDPVVIRSDFYGIDPTLDAKLEDLFAQLENFDVDQDNRLRVGHPIEGAGIPDNSEDYDGDASPDNAFVDITGDGYVDEFDVFINHYDTNHDGRVALSDALRYGTPSDGLAAEFTADDDLALLIDSLSPDRNRNGVSGFTDLNGNGRWDPADESLLDYDTRNSTYPDQVLGYRDGVLDALDQYSKVHGSIGFKITSAGWTAAQGDYGDKLRGPITGGNGAPLQFGVSDDDLPYIDVDTLGETGEELRDDADGASFEQQLADNLGVSVDALAAYSEAKPDGTNQPRYFRLDPDTDGDGLPDNYATAYYEKMPFNSPNYTDWYYRPVIENMTFRDVQIPRGTNALFVNCTFIGVTWVHSYPLNNHPHWSLYGRMVWDAAEGHPAPAYPRTVYGDDAGEDGTDAPSMLPGSAIPPDQLLLLADEPLDKGDILDSQVGAFDAGDYANLPDPLLIEGKRVTDTKLYANNLRFHDCLVVGSIVSDTPEQYTHVRNKMQFTGATRFQQKHPEFPDDPQYNPESDDVAEIIKSSMLLPNYSVDIGAFNSPNSQDVQLKGAVIAGVLDVRGNASIDGALLLTFAPTAGAGPLRDFLGNPIGNPANFNSSIGYFGPEDGDEESLDPETLPIVGGDRIVGWDTDGDGLADVSPFEAQPPGSTAVPFYGYGKVTLRFDPNMILPDGVMLPMSIGAVSGSYREGKP
ncbi:MAG: hypothetical protein RBS39_04600 [Phycisphaerales bacterium]|jgi:hypothetical protein|nr:hypothetical protein [Phycisphaerales bacterium]